VARQYAQRGAKVCIVGRREDLLAEVKAECWSLRDPAVQRQDIPALNFVKPNDPVIAVAADFVSPEEMGNVKDTLKTGMPALGTRQTYR
jgi:NAD(P)-dependent dehydrogenase (short-subunit alcohol dehydrogenase family)